MNFTQSMHGTGKRAIKLLSNSEQVIPLRLTVGHATRTASCLSCFFSKLVNLIIKFLYLILH
ncbi:MAG: hypothetical protein F6K50_15480 [Moorea sp. SIO3I7]|uniref:hypothetical protein n=1 Tax=unclassified Moorena TaxID=2683338 RepID=UPI0013CC1D68|nr:MULTISPECIES: hypothetical protein [unclassified Moorena]NEN96881.1 hypothetical protein [Moorena sp. SIO3I7]NEO23123.1 hypothetical protein [Moorena sp. SIO4A5]NEQ62177.1 hypothetical protein [Moorena sp. SIO4A1]